MALSISPGKVWYQSHTTAKKIEFKGVDDVSKKDLYKYNDKRPVAVIYAKSKSNKLLNQHNIYSGSKNRPNVLPFGKDSFISRQPF